MTTGHTPVSEAWITWTGGSKPDHLYAISEIERELVNALYHAQCAGFRAFWGKEPTDEIRDMYVLRARYDAHATMRAGCVQQNGGVNVGGVK